jgi:hypothetical protein
MGGRLGLEQTGNGGEAGGEEAADELGFHDLFL